MYKRILKHIIITVIYMLISFKSFGQILNEIKITGNERISDQTIILLYNRRKTHFCNGVTKRLNHVDIFYVCIFAMTQYLRNKAKYIERLKNYQNKFDYLKINDSYIEFAVFSYFHHITLFCL